ncbi:MAG: InlB B-repeat-containing protein, partial [Kiritimatiellae bacterium]|nr:InlB B-repeat-containing protein [Kiritimatiellia bacterium]
GIAGVNAASGALEACYVHAWFDNVSNVNITRGAICGSNAGTVRRCGGLHDNRNYFDGAVGSGTGTVEDTSFPAASAFSSGEVCYALNGGVTDGSQPWYQNLDSWGFEGGLPVFAGPTVYLHGSKGYVNTVAHDWTITFAEPTPDYSNFVWAVTCRICGETHTVSTNGTAAVTREPTCTEPGQTTWTYRMPKNDYFNYVSDSTAVQLAPAALGHDWGAPEYSWYSAPQGTFCHTFRTCARCDATTNETVAATLVSSLAPTCTAPGTNTCAAAFASPLFAPQTNAFEVAALGHAWGEATYVWAVDHSSVTASNACTRCGQTVQETAATTISATTAPTCTEPGTMTLAADFSSPAFSPQSKTIGADPALGHDWGAPVWNWNADYTAATATFACSRCDEAETVAAAVAHAPGEGDATNCTATVVHHGETFTDTVVLRPPVTYIDADGVERQCIRYTVLLYDNGWYSYGEEGAENWYVVSSNVTSGLPFNFHDAHAHLILCDGATLTASNPGGYFAICADGSLTIYGQSGGTGAIFASADIHAIVADDNITLNGGIVEATTPDPDVYDGIRAGIATINGGVVRGSICGGCGVTVNGGVVESSMLSTFNSYDIVLGWTNATDSITAAAYSARSVSVRAGQRFWNGEEFVGDGELAGRTLTPAYEITYALNGGSVEGKNPAFYARESEEIVLANPVRVGYDFAGWIGTGLAAPTNRVVIPRGSVGHRAYAATWERITAVPYIDENGDPQVCTDFICLSGASGNVVAGVGPTNWYVVSGRVAIDGHLRFQGERSCIILRDGATLAVTNATDTVDDAIRAEGRLEIYGQAGGTGAIAARGNLVSNDDDGIQADSLAIYGGSVRAVGAYGIYVTGDLVMGGGTVVARAENGNGIQADGLLVRGGAIDSAGSSRGIYVKKDGMTVLGGTVSAVCSSLWATGIYVANGDLAVRGGSVVAAGNKSAAIYVRNGGFTMSGGAVTATSADAADGIYASGDIVLGWTDLADFILAESYTSGSGGAVSVRKGQTFADEGGNLYEGELDSGELAAARGKTLRPYIASYAAWAAASGVSGAWNETDALGIHNVFRYAFDKPTGAFENPPLLGIAFAADGTALVLTPPLVNTTGFDFSLLATDDLAGANPATFPLDPSGTNAVPASSSSARFFRLKAAER